MLYFQKGFALRYTKFFHSLTSALAFQTLLGDAIRETFLHTEVPTSALRSFIANIQLAALFLMFSYVVVNCCVAIVEGKFFETFSAEIRDVIVKRRSRQVHLRTTIQDLLLRAARKARRARGF